VTFLFESVQEIFKKFLQRNERIPQKLPWKKAKPGDVVLEMSGIVKSFPGVTANDHINFKIKAGEVHGILGENGAGKSTLMKILYGFYKPDEGEIRIMGKRVDLRSPKDAINLGIGMVHQHFMLVDPFTVAENVVLGQESGFTLDLDQVEKRISDLSKQYNLKVNPKAKIWQLSAGKRQRIEILKARYRGARLLILDEPTSVLTPEEIKELMVTIRKMADERIAVIPFITHKLPEVLAITDRITVLRQGKVVGEIVTKDSNEKELAKKMVGKEVLFCVEKCKVQQGKIVLEIKDLESLGEQGLKSLKKVSFTLHKGEILGIAGVSGNGQRELVETLMGLRKATGGKIYINGNDVTNKSPKNILNMKVGYIPEDRITAGSIKDFTVAENLILGISSNPQCSNRMILNKQEIDKYAEKLVAEYDIRTPNINTLAETLSGGNLQKLILAGEFSKKPELLIAHNPTMGLDISAIEFIHKKLIEKKEEMVAILLISEDLDEIMSLTDSIAVMYEGEITGLCSTTNAKIKDIGLMMAGSKLEELKKTSIESEITRTKKRTKDEKSIQKDKN
jgi:simple sugar transport system ATP-binding protein